MYFGSQSFGDQVESRNFLFIKCDGAGGTSPLLSGLPENMQGLSDVICIPRGKTLNFWFKNMKYKVKSGEIRKGFFEPLVGFMMGLSCSLVDKKKGL